MYTQLSRTTVLKKHKKTNSEIPALNCEEIGCAPNLSQNELECGEDIWLHYEKRAGGKITNFAIKLSSKRIDYAEWLAGTKTKWQKKLFNTPQLARVEFAEMIASKKTSGFSFTAAKV